MMTDKCNHLIALMRVESDIIKKHIDTHKWFRHIEDYNDGVADFIENYGWLMREMYCGHVCEHRCDCQMAQQFHDKNQTKAC